MAGGKKSTSQMDNKISWAAVMRVFDLRTIFELVNDGRNDRSFAQ